MVKKIKILLISASLIISSLYVVNAEDVLQEGLNRSLNNLGEAIQSALPGPGDTEITINTQVQILFDHCLYPLLHAILHLH